MKQPLLHQGVGLNESFGWRMERVCWSRAMDVVRHASRLHVFTAPFGTGFVNSQVDGGHPYCPCPAFAGASTAGILASRTSLLKAARSVVSRPFRVFSSAFARVARSSYTMLDCAVGWLSELSTPRNTCERGTEDSEW